MTDSLDNDSSLGISSWPPDQATEDNYQEQMDPKVIDDLRSKARDSLGHLVRLKPKNDTQQRTIGEVGGHIAGLTRFARLSHHVVSVISFEDLIDVSV